MMILFFIIGCIFGSFINVVLSRKDWYKGRSRCDTCGYVLKWVDLIPIISFCLLKGKCRKCHSKIGALHLASELYMGCGFAVVSIYFQHSMMAAMIQIAAIIFLGIYAISDTKEYAVSTLYLYGGLMTVSLLRMIDILSMADAQKAAIFVITHGIVYAVFRLVAKKVQNHIGEGDFDIFMLILLAVGAFKTLICITIASVIGTALYLPLVINKKHERAKPIPLAPLLYVGFVITLLGGVAI
ncbi:MAG: prepilin peptidase [Clostridiaceae bacterium]|nr:prepilin peptidase [Clostridiaceae bacterium]